MKQILAAKCASCGKLTYPTHFTCPGCGGTEFEGVPIEGGGKLVTYTRAYNLALDYEVRYLTLGIVAMDQGVNVTGQLEIDEPRTGMRVSSRVGVVREVEGIEKHGLVFRSAE